MQLRASHGTEETQRPESEASEPPSGDDGLATGHVTLEVQDGKIGIEKEAKHG